MKKLLISSMVAVLCMGASVVYADDAHHPAQDGASAPKSATGKSAPPKKPAVPDKSISSAGNGMDKAQESMKQAQALMAKLREAKDPAERKKLMQQHTQAMRDTMGMMAEMKIGMMNGSQGMGMGMMSKGKAKTGDMMNNHQMMGERMEMMQMMMEQIIERQEMLMQDGK